MADPMKKYTTKELFTELAQVSECLGRVRMSVGGWEVSNIGGGATRVFVDISSDQSNAGENVLARESTKTMNEKLFDAVGALICARGTLTAMAERGAALIEANTSAEMAAIERLSDQRWSLLCDVGLALGMVVPERIPKIVEHAQNVAKRLEYAEREYKLEKEKSASLEVVATRLDGELRAARADLDQSRRETAHTRSRVEFLETSVDRMYESAKDRYVDRVLSVIDVPSNTIVPQTAAMHAADVVDAVVVESTRRHARFEAADREKNGLAK